MSAPYRTKCNYHEQNILYKNHISKNERTGRFCEEFDSRWGDMYTFNNSHSTEFYVSRHDYLVSFRYSRVNSHHSEVHGDGV